jgi:hypothetical protein
MLWLARRARQQTLARNHWIGIRTTATLASDDAWRRGHAAASTPILVGGAGLVVAAVAAVVAGEDNAVVAAMIGCAWIVLWLIIGTVAAGKAARA